MGFPTPDDVQRLETADQWTTEQHQRYRAEILDDLAQEIKKHFSQSDNPLDYKPRPLSWLERWWRVNHDSIGQFVSEKGWEIYFTYEIDLDRQNPVLHIAKPALKGRET